MRRLPPLVLAASLPILGSTLGGCVALAVPVAAAGVMGKRVIDPDKDRGPAATAPAATAPQPTAQAPTGEPGVTFLPAGSSLPAPAAPTAAGAAPPASPPNAGLPRDGTGEAAAASHQAWRALVRFVAKSVSTPPEDSVVLAPGASLDAPTWVPCAQKPPAAVFDFTAAAAADDGAARDAIGILRTMGVEPVFSDAAGQRGGDRLAALAARYCVVAIGGDALGDFSALFDAAPTPAARDAAASSVAIGAKWGAGWFLLADPAGAGPAARTTP